MKKYDCCEEPYPSLKFHLTKKKFRWGVSGWRTRGSSGIRECRKKGVRVPSIGNPLGATCDPAGPRHPLIHSNAQRCNLLPEQHVRKIRQINSDWNYNYGTFLCDTYQYWHGIWYVLSGLLARILHFSHWRSSDSRSPSKDILVSFSVDTVIYGYWSELPTFDQRATQHIAWELEIRHLMLNYCQTLSNHLVNFHAYHNHVFVSPMHCQKSTWHS